MASHAPEGHVQLAAERLHETVSFDVEPGHARAGVRVIACVDDGGICLGGAVCNVVAGLQNAEIQIIFGKLVGAGCADDACADMDAKATAAELAKLVAQIGDVDLVVCGDGSADNYAQQVDVQLACKLGWPVVNAATKITCKGDVLEVERTLEDAVEVVEVSLPAVVSVTPDAAEPRIPGMKDILAAGKKPMNVAGASDVAAAAIEVLDCKAPEQADRKLEIFDASEDGAIDNFVAAIKAAL